jgi:hypothetical protein
MAKKEDTNQVQTTPGTTTQGHHNARDSKTRFNLRLPNQLMENLKAESTRTGRGMTDIVIEQLWYRYPME